ncbi:MAG: DUF5916 domain-containing protein [Ignavibacteriales bacterium]
MKVVLLLLLCAEIVFAGSGPNSLLLKKAQTDIRIDGVIDPVWDTADSAGNYFQLQPFYSEKPSQNTVAKVLATEDALYCLIIAYDNSGQVQANAGTLDQENGDIVSIMLDTYNDKRTAYRFTVTAAGAKGDCRMLDDGRNTDNSWDGVWSADSRVYEWGYVVEMKIPFKSISYDKTKNEWGLDFDRWIPHSREDLYWNHYEQSEGLRISKFGQLSFNEIHPVNTGMNVELYPVGLTNIVLQQNGKYKVKPDAGLDIFYNPSPSLTFQLTANPDFAQIEADPYDFNISRYESYFDEKRPFFTQGNEIFMASGKQKSSGFYKPLELFYSRRIGKKLRDGTEVPLITGAKAFGRIDDWEYGGFLAISGNKEYSFDNQLYKEERSYFGAARIKKQILDNSTLGLMLVNKRTGNSNSGVMDIDGAFRESDWQWSYQIARSFKDNSGDYAFASGFMLQKKSWLLFTRTRYIGDNFDINDVGYVPWKGTGEFVSIMGPTWYFETGPIRSILLYGGPVLNYEKVDNYTDHSLILGFNMQLRSNWGYEINYTLGKSRDQGINFNSYELSLSSWYNISPDWDANLGAGYSRTYNFTRSYLASYMWLNNSLGWNASKNLRIGYDYGMWVENKPDGSLEDITYNSRPFISLVPVNNLTLRLYVDNVYLRSSDRFERFIAGFLFSYNFLPKSWIYFAYNEVQNRLQQTDGAGNLIPVWEMQVTDRASVFKIKYLYYF